MIEIVTTLRELQAISAEALAVIMFLLLARRIIIIELEKTQEKVAATI